MPFKRVMWLGLALCAAGCVGGGEQTKQADAVTQRFIDALDAKAYPAAYAEVSPEFKATMSEDLFEGFVKRIDRKLGPCQAPVKDGNWRVNATTNGYFRDQGYTRACAKGTLQISVNVVVRGGEAKILGYRATSPLLLTD